MLKYPDGGLAQVLYTAVGNSKAGKEFFEAFGNGNFVRVEDYRSFSAYGSATNLEKMKKGDKGHLNELVEFAETIKGLTGSVDGADARAGKLASEIALTLYKCSRKSWKGHDPDRC
jgi:hypothetical protein